MMKTLRSMNVRRLASLLGAFLFLALPAVAKAQSQAPFAREELLQLCDATYKQINKGGYNFLGYAESKLAVRGIVKAVKKRGVSSKLKEPFDDEMHRTCGPGVRSAAADNYGTPPPREAPGSVKYLTGVWDMTQTGQTVTQRGGIETRSASGAKAGFVRINGDGTYIWKLYSTSSPSEYLKGQWRKATDQEMDTDEDDEGILLLKAKDGKDWIVTKRIIKSLKGDFVTIAVVDMKALHQIGQRGK